MLGPLYNMLWLSSLGFGFFFFSFFFETSNNVSVGVLNAFVCSLELSSPTVLPPLGLIKGFSPNHIASCYVLFA